MLTSSHACKESTRFLSGHVKHNSVDLGQHNEDGTGVMSGAVKLERLVDETLTSQSDVMLLGMAAVNTNDSIDEGKGVPLVPPLNEQPFSFIGHSISRSLGGYAARSRKSLRLTRRSSARRASRSNRTPSATASDGSSARRRSGRRLVKLRDRSRSRLGAVRKNRRVTRASDSRPGKSKRSRRGLTRSGPHSSPKRKCQSRRCSPTSFSRSGT
jgi:hypothetical protein